MTVLAIEAPIPAQAETVAAMPVSSVVLERNEALKLASAASVTAIKTASVAGVAVVKAASLTGAAAVEGVATGSVGVFKKVSASGAKVFDRVSAVNACPSCGSISIKRTEASGFFQDAYRCEKCDHEFTAIGPIAAKRLLRAALGLGLLVTTGVHL